MMGRPKGSKNKPKGDVGWQNQKEKIQQPVVSVENPPKRGRKPKIDTTILPLEKSVGLLCGTESAPIASIPTEAKSGLTKQRSQITGWITINLAPKTRWKSEAYYTGADIHPTREEALAVTAAHRVGVAYIDCEVKV